MVWKKCINYIFQPESFLKINNKMENFDVLHYVINIWILYKMECTQPEMKGKGT